MAANWFRVENSFFRHRKTLRLKRLVGNDALWLPLRLWSYATENESSDLSKLDDTDLGAVLDYPGDPVALRSALIDAGFLSPDGKTVVGWDERYAEKLKFYHERAVKAAAVRWSRPQDEGAPSGNRKDDPIPDQTRLDKISKHRQACFKDASSIKGARKRDLAFDALAIVGGAMLAELTKPAMRETGTALAAIRAVAPDVTAEEIHRRAVLYRQRHPTWSITPSALAKHWAACGDEQSVNPLAATASIYREIS